MAGEGGIVERLHVAQRNLKHLDVRILSYLCYALVRYFKHRYQSLPQLTILFDQMS